MNYLCYYHYDGLGSTRNLTEQSDNIISSYWYDGFGNLIGKVDQYPVAPVPNNYLFTGEQFDQSLRFYYLRARYYNPEIGRFITADPVEGSIYEPISLHKYLYAGLDPVNKIDPSGEEFLMQHITAISIIMIASAIIIPEAIKFKRGMAFMLYWMWFPSDQFIVMQVNEKITSPSFVNSFRIDPELGFKKVYFEAENIIRSPGLDFRYIVSKSLLVATAAVSFAYRGPLSEGQHLEKLERLVSAYPENSITIKGFPTGYDAFTHFYHSALWTFTVTKPVALTAGWFNEAISAIPILGRYIGHYEKVDLIVNAMGAEFGKELWFRASF